MRAWYSPATRSTDVRSPNRAGSAGCKWPKAAAGKSLRNTRWNMCGPPHPCGALSEDCRQFSAPHGKLIGMQLFDESRAACWVRGSQAILFAYCVRCPDARTMCRYQQSGGAFEIRRRNMEADGETEAINTGPARGYLRDCSKAGGRAWRPASPSRLRSAAGGVRRLCGRCLNPRCWTRLQSRTGDHAPAAA